jgi:pyruvate dehydrogenase E1 component alpha subunit
VHFGDMRRGDVAFLSPMADGIPVAVGVALALKREGRRRVAMTWFGEGAASRGDFHEGVNLGAVLRVPVVFVCNNNRYAYSTPLERQTPVPDIAARAPGYGIPAAVVDGMDVLAVYAAVLQAVQRARAGEGPSLVECKTMRLRGHSEHDDASYVPGHQREEARARDPVPSFERRLLEAGVLDQAARDRVAAEISAELEEALAWAEASPLPDAKDVADGVYG